MNKKEVAEALGVSTRLVEKYSSEGRLGEVTYIRGKTGKQADFDAQAVDRLKAELEAPDRPLPAVAPNTRATGLVVASDVDRDRFITALEKIASQGQQTSARASVAIEAKPLLKLDEASALTGLSRAILREAIERKKLKAKLIGRAWRILRTDLDNYLKKL